MRLRILQNYMGVKRNTDVQNLHSQAGQGLDHTVSLPCITLILKTPHYNMNSIFSGFKLII